EDGELDAAAGVLALARKHIGGPFVAARDVQLAARQKRIPEAVASLRALCAMPTEDRWPLDAALQALKGAGASSAALDAMLAAAAAEPANPLVGSVWARASMESGRWSPLRDGLARLEGHPRAWAE